MRALVLRTLLCVPLLAACAMSPDPVGEAPAGPEMPLPVGGFSAERAWAHLTALSSLGPRSAGAPGNLAARDYLRAELEALGLATREQRVGFEVDGEPREARNLVAGVPGASSDLVVFAAPFDSRPSGLAEFQGADAASGAAILLDLARQLSFAPLPYTAWFVFLDGESPPVAHGEEGASPRIGSRGFALRLRSLEAQPQLRLIVFVDRVCREDVQVARDLASLRAYREEFWRVAGDLDRREVFPQDAPFENPGGAHRVLSSAGARRGVGLVGTGEDDDPLDPLERCSPKSLESVGRVALEGTRVVTERLARIDRFAEAPVLATEALRLEHLDDEADGDAPTGAEADAATAPEPEAVADPEPAVDPEPSAATDVEPDPAADAARAHPAESSAGEPPAAEVNAE